MKRIDFNNGWKYRRAGGNESWKEVTIPHDPTAPGGSIPVGLRDMIMFMRKHLKCLKR